MPTIAAAATSNLGEMENKGIEFQVDGYIFRSKDFYWKLGTSGYMNRNKITKINKALEEINNKNEENSSSSLVPLPQYAAGRLSIWTMTRRLSMLILYACRR